MIAMAAGKKPFKAVPTELKRTLRIPVRVNAEEKAQLDHAAQIRNLDTSDWLRRAGLGRKADVRYDTQIVLAITQSVQAIRTTGLDILSLAPTLANEPASAKLHQLLDEMRQAVVEAKAALLRIDK